MVCSCGDSIAAGLVGLGGDAELIGGRPPLIWAYTVFPAHSSKGTSAPNLVKKLCNLRILRLYCSGFLLF
jgi:hypothetical protein